MRKREDSCLKIPSGHGPLPILSLWKRNDFFFLAVLLLLAGALFLLPRLIFQEESKGPHQAEITVEGHSVMTIPLADSYDSSVLHRASVPGTGIVVSWDASGIWVEQSPCPDQVCVRTGKISRTSQVIACLPEKLLIQIQVDEGGELEGPDLTVG